MLKKSIISITLASTLMLGSEVNFKEMLQEYENISKEREAVQVHKDAFESDAKKNLTFENVKAQADKDIYKADYGLSEKTLNKIKGDSDYKFITHVFDMIDNGDDLHVALDGDIHLVISDKISTLMDRYMLSDIYNFYDKLDSYSSKINSNGNISKEIVVRNKNIGANLREHPFFEYKPSILVSKSEITDGTILNVLKKIKIDKNNWAKVQVLSGKHAGTIAWINLKLTKVII